MAWLWNPIDLFWGRRRNPLTYLQIVFVTYGVIHAFLPAEPFYVKYMRDVVGLTQQEVVNEALPWFSYTHLLVLLVFGIVTEWLVPYKLIILFSIIMGQGASRVLLMWGKDLRAMQFSEAAFAVGIAGEAVFHSYYFTLVPKKDFHTINSYSRASNYLGRLLSSLTGQLLLDHKGTPLRTLFFVSFWTVSVSAVIAAIFFPNGERPDFLRKKEIAALADAALPPIAEEGNSRRHPLHRFKNRTQKYFKTVLPPALLPPLVIYVLGLSQYVFCSAYAQTLWHALDNTITWNGYITGSSHAAIMIVTLATGFLRKHFDYHILMLPFVFFCSVFIIMQASAVKTSIYFAYAGYIGAISCAYAIVSLSAGEMALRAKPNTTGGKPPFATLFAFVSLLVSSTQLVMQIILSRRLRLDPVHRFYVYAAFSIFTLLITLLIAFFETLKARRESLIKPEDRLVPPHHEEAMLMTTTTTPPPPISSAMTPTAPPAETETYYRIVHAKRDRIDSRRQEQFQIGSDHGDDEVTATQPC